jgi:hypothetical protein
MIRGSTRPVGVRARLADARAVLRLGGFWMAVPVAVVALVTSGGAVAPVGTLVVFVVVAAAARRRGRDLSVGYIAGLLVCLSALVASAYGQAAGAGAVLAYPPGLTGLIGVAGAARIGLDRGFRPWQRVAALSVGAAALAAAASADAFMAAAIACVTFLIWRLSASRRRTRIDVPGPMPAGPFTSAARAGAPLAALAALWVATFVTAPRPASDVARFVALGSSGAFDRLFGNPYAATGWLDAVALVVGAALIVWRVTGPGLPVWVPVVGLSGVVGVLLAPDREPSPGWVLALTAELWVFCHGLRTDRNVIPAPRVEIDR